MKIVRNGEEIKLTCEEKLNIYAEMDDNYRREDIAYRAEQDEIEMTEHELGEISKRLEKLLENNSYYWDIYWDAVDTAIKECKEGK